MKTPEQIADGIIDRFIEGKGRFSSRDLIVEAIKAERNRLAGTLPRDEEYEFELVGGTVIELAAPVTTKMKIGDIIALVSDSVLMDELEFRGFKVGDGI